jgi:hypothetical protein
MEEELKLKYFALELGISNGLTSEVSEDDDQWALVLMRVYRTMKSGIKPTPSESTPEGLS